MRHRVCNELLTRKWNVSIFPLHPLTAVNEMNDIIGGCLGILIGSFVALSPVFLAMLCDWRAKRRYARICKEVELQTAQRLAHMAAFYDRMGRDITRTY